MYFPPDTVVNSINSQGDSKLPMRSVGICLKYIFSACLAFTLRLTSSHWAVFGNQHDYLKLRLKLINYSFKYFQPLTVPLFPLFENELFHMYN